MRLTVEVLSGPKAGATLEVPPGATVDFGRSQATADTLGVDGYMSGRHFAVVHEGEQARVRDLDSRNGTTLNGARVTDAELHDGDQIVAGQTTFVVRIAAAEPMPERPPPPPPPETVAPVRKAGGWPALGRARSAGPEATAPPPPPRRRGLSPSPPPPAREDVSRDRTLDRPQKPLPHPETPRVEKPVHEQPRGEIVWGRDRTSPAGSTAARGALPPPRVMKDVLEEHFEELDFLWEQRERRLFSPDWTVVQLAEHEERCEAHLDGLRIGGEHSVEIARPFLGGEESGAATAAAFVFLAAGSPELAGQLLDALAEANDAVRTGIRIGLRHGEVGAVTDRLYGLALGKDQALRALAVDVLAFHRLKPPPEVDRLLGDGDPAIRRVAFGAAGRMKNVLTIRHIEEALESEDVRLRRVALEAGARAGLADVLALCRKAARGARAVPEAVAFLGVVGSREDVGTLRSALGETTVAGAAIEGLGALGEPSSIPLLIEAMSKEDLAEHAATAFTRVTGIHDIRGPKPAPRLESDDEDEGPPVEPARAAAAWERIKSQLTPNARWQRGHSVTAMGLAAAMAALPLDSRRDAYLGARAGQGQGVPDVEIESRVAVRR